MTFSGSVSPTFTESNSRNAIVEATFFSLYSRATGQGRIRLLDHFTGFVGHDVLGDDDVRAERLPNRVHVHIAVQLVAGLDRLQELQLLVDLDDLGVLDSDVGVREERRLRLVSEHRDERQRREEPAVAEVGGGLV